jgi:hypothetical protein
MKWYARALISLTVTLSGLTLAYSGALLIGTGYGPAAPVGFIIMLIGLVATVSGLAYLLYKPDGTGQKLAEMPPRGGPEDVGTAARERKERAVRVGMNVPTNSMWFRAPPGDGLPARSLQEKWER